MPGLQTITTFCFKWGLLISHSLKTEDPFSLFSYLSFIFHSGPTRVLPAPGNCHFFPQLFVSIPKAITIGVTNFSTELHTLWGTYCVKMFSQPSDEKPLQGHTLYVWPPSPFRMHTCWVNPRCLFRMDSVRAIWAQSQKPIDLSNWFDWSY